MKGRGNNRISYDIHAGSLNRPILFYYTFRAHYKIKLHGKNHQSNDYYHCWHTINKQIYHLFFAILKKKN